MTAANNPGENPTTKIVFFYHPSHFDDEGDNPSALGKNP